MAGELFKMMAGVDMVHVPYRGDALVLTDLMGGQVQVMFDNVPTSAEHIKAGKLRGLAVTSTARSECCRTCPRWLISCPVTRLARGTVWGCRRTRPTRSSDKVNKAMNAILADPKSQARFAALGASLLPGSAADFGKLLAEETEKWGKVVKFAGAKPD